MEIFSLAESEKFSLRQRLSDREGLSHPHMQRNTDVLPMEFRTFFFDKIFFLKTRSSQTSTDLNNEIKSAFPLETKRPLLQVNKFEEVRLVRCPKVNRLGVTDNQTDRHYPSYVLLSQSLFQ